MPFETMMNGQVPFGLITSNKPHFYDDFSMPTQVRQNRLIADNKTLYVNLGYLAEYSAYFANSMQNSDDPVYLDKPYDDVLELMQCLFFCPKKKPITHTNINTIAELAAYYGMEPVLKRCENLISKQANFFTPDRLLYLKKILLKHQFNNMPTLVPIDRMTRIDHTQLSTPSFNYNRDDKRKGRRPSINNFISSDLLLKLKRRRIFEDAERAYHEQKQQNERDRRCKEIKELEKEAQARASARRNRQMNNEKYIRMKLELHGLVLERKPRVEEFAVLPEEAELMVEKAWNSPGSLMEVFSSAFNVDITRRDLLTLKGLDWLNDEIINFYLNLIVERSGRNNDLPRVYAFNTFFFQSLSTKGYDAIKRWTRKVDIFSFDLLLLPIHLTVHWCMATIDLKKKCISYFDSMLGDNDRCLEIIRNYLEKEHENKKKIMLRTNDWRKLCRKDIPQQFNGSDCGVFACKFAEYSSRDASIDFTQAEMPYFRRRMVYEICTQKLL